VQQRLERLRLIVQAEALAIAVAVDVGLADPQSRSAGVRGNDGLREARLRRLWPGVCAVRRDWTRPGALF
jgi:hypothetical protein